MLSAVLNGTWIWCRILRLRHRESSNIPAPSQNLRGLKGPETELSIHLLKTPKKAVVGGFRVIRVNS
jgi:hypothetical protein